MKHISVSVAPSEFRRLKAGKGERSWKAALLEDVAVPRGEVTDD